MSLLVRNRFNQGRFNNYLIAGNICNAFALGEIASNDDFFLVGSEPEDESSYPLLTGNILDSDGHLLFKLVRNVLVINPGNCSKIKADLTSYEIHDSAGKPILSVKTMFEPLPGADQPMYITTIRAAFYDRSGKLVFQANSGDAEERIEANCKAMLGYGGFVQGYGPQELQFVKVVMATHGRVNRMAVGVIEKQELSLEGLVLKDATVKGCTIHVPSGNFAILGNCRFDECRFLFEGEAQNVFKLAMLFQRQTPADAPR